MFVGGWSYDLGKGQCHSLNDTVLQDSRASLTKVAFLAHFFPLRLKRRKRLISFKRYLFLFINTCGGQQRMLDSLELKFLGYCNLPDVGAGN